MTLFCRGSKKASRMGVGLGGSFVVRVRGWLRIDAREKDALGLGELIFEEMRNAYLHLDHIAFPSPH